MASIDFNKVRRAFRVKLNELGDRVPQKAWENDVSDSQQNPPPGTEAIPPQIVERMTPGSQPRVSTGYIQTDSILIYNIRVKSGSGTERVEGWAALIASHFQAGTQLHFEGYNIKVEKTEQMPGNNNGDGFYTVPVYITYMLHVPVKFVSEP